MPSTTVTRQEAAHHEAFSPDSRDCIVCRSSAFYATQPTQNTSRGLMCAPNCSPLCAPVSIRKSMRTIRKLRRTGALRMRHAMRRQPMVIPHMAHRRRAAVHRASVRAPTEVSTIGRSSIGCTTILDAYKFRTSFPEDIDRGRNFCFRVCSSGTEPGVKPGSCFMAAVSVALSPVHLRLPAGRPFASPECRSSTTKILDRSCNAILLDVRHS